jgi:hypothetical protein
MLNLHKEIPLVATKKPSTVPLVDESLGTERRISISIRSPLEARTEACTSIARYVYIVRAGEGWLLVEDETTSSAPARSFTFRQGHGTP